MSSRRITGLKAANHPTNRLTRLCEAAANAIEELKLEGDRIVVMADTDTDGGLALSGYADDELGLAAANIAAALEALARVGGATVTVTVTRPAAGQN